MAEDAEKLGIQFMAEVRQVKTMADHSANLTVNIPEDFIEAAKLFIGWQGDQVEIIAVNMSRAPDKRC